MITSISIKNYALISELNIDLSPGLNVITGETGAGKSIIIDALSLLLGGRAARGNIRAGEKKMMVSALFDIREVPEVKEKLEARGVPLDEDELILSREIDRRSKNVCRANGVIVPLSLFKEIGLELVDIHSQHEHVSLFRSENQRKLLDAYAGKEALSLLEDMRELTRQLQGLAKRILELQKTGKEATKQNAIDKYELAEIDKVQLVEGEESELLESEKSLIKGEALFEKSINAASLLSNEDVETPAITDLLSDLIASLESLCKEDHWFDPYLEQVREASAQLSSLSYDLTSYIDNLDYDPKKLSSVQNRLGEIEELKRKYGDTVEEIIAYGEKLREKLETFDNAEDLLKDAKEEYKLVRGEYNKKAVKLTDIRGKTAKALEKELESELKDLAMDKARVNIKIDSDPAVISVNGQDSVTFLLSVNPGVEPGELKRVASGGEVSRIMLAIKGIFGDKDHIETMIFDEIDTGISGRTAQVVAEKITKLARSRQIICITHLPQIAAMADSQFLVTKVSGEESTQVSFEELNENTRTLELARMLGGAEVTELTKRHAEEMIRQAVTLKETQPAV